MMIRVVCLGIFLVTLIAYQSSKSVVKTFKDPRDGQKYGYIQLDDYYWMTENMRYNIEGSVWNEHNPDTIFGRLYDGHQALKVCPKGWKLTSTLDWFYLEKMLGI